jgi:hypothetical protein
MAKVCRRAIWLSRLCTAWLHFQGGDHRAARIIEPYDIPDLGWWDADLVKEIKQARRESGYWDHPTFYKSRFRTLKRGPTTYPAKSPLPAPKLLISWTEVFDHWMSGALDRGIKDSMANLPKASRNKLKEIIA